MIATLRRSEEGQALVLAAIFGLVLMLCVLGTVNLGRAVYDKVQLQAAADSAAYSAAALEARVMNFTAYTNRAMVVHYASLMAATSYLTWLHFIWAGLRPMLEILSAVPYVGPIAATIQNGLRALLRTLDAGIAALAPLLSAANVLLYGLQEAAWHSVWLRLGKPIQPEAHSGDSAAHPYQPLWPQLLPLANQAVFAQARGHPTMPQNAEESLQMLTGAKTDAVRLARLHMLEIANSARQPWVAYGDRAGDPSLSPMARHFKWKLSIGLASLQLGSVARTELGGFSAGSSQVWSAQRLELVAKLFGFRKSVNLLSLVAIDQLPGPSPVSENQYALLFSVPGWLKPLGGSGSRPTCPSRRKRERSQGRGPPVGPATLANPTWSSGSRCQRATSTPSPALPGSSGGGPDPARRTSGSRTRTLPRFPACRAVFTCCARGSTRFRPRRPTTTGPATGARCPTSSTRSGARG